jgi:hypothetical protein
VVRRRERELLAGVSGCGRLWPAVCGECARKPLWVRRFRWSQACSLGTVNPSRKLRRFESFTCHRVRERASDLRKRGQRLSSHTWRGYPNCPCFGGHQVRRPQACDLRKRGRRTGDVEIRGEYVRKLESVARGLAGLIRADLRSCPGVGYPMKVDCCTIAFEQQWYRSC